LKGYFGSILKIDLTSQTSKIKTFSEKTAIEYLGGRGLGSKLLYDEAHIGVDALSSENMLIFSTGPLTGTKAPCASRLAVVTKSPVSGTINISMVGGSFPTYLKRTGHDAIIVIGRAKEKIWISVTPDAVRFHSAKEIWGLNTTETTEAVRKAAGKDFKVACIGPAGENLVLFSAIVAEKRTAARGAPGAVMGSKNLKAIAVAGDKEVEVADENNFKQNVAEAFEFIKDNFICDNLRENGTAINIQTLNEAGALPTRNFQRTTFDGYENISAKTLKEKYFVKLAPCLNCPSSCGRLSEVREGQYAGIQVDGPEYETIVMLGSNLGNDRLDSIIAANYLCDELGMDTISTGNVIGFAMECYEKGIITKEKVGVDLKWGNHEAVIQLIKDIAVRKDFGDLLAQGTKRVAEKIGGGVGDFAMHVKGLEIPAYDPRSMPGLALSYAVSPRGGDHGKAGFTIHSELGGGVFDPVEKAKLVKRAGNTSAIIDSAVVCVFSMLVLDPNIIPKLLTSVTGVEYSREKLDSTADKIFNVERLFNIREGFTSEDDVLPKRFTSEPSIDEPSKNCKVERLDEMKRAYYKERGWSENGIPPSEKS
jgi:aldehyde:ferredoxin oxidoreductase